MDDTIGEGWDWSKIYGPRDDKQREEPKGPTWDCPYCRAGFPMLGTPPRECPTPGCRNPFGLGGYRWTPRPQR